MKRLLYIFILLVFNFTLKAQQPLTQNLGSDSTLVRLGPTFNGIIKGGIVLASYSDTTSANATHIDFYTGAAIWSTSDTSIYVRNKTSTNAYWFRVSGAGGGTGGSAWQVGGNPFAVVPAAGPRIGTTAVGSSNFILMTNGVDRLTFLGTGLANLTASTDSILVRSAAGDVGLIAKSAVSPTWQQTLTAGSTLTGNNTIAGGGFNFTFGNSGAITFDGDLSDPFTVQEYSDILLNAGAAPGNTIRLNSSNNISISADNGNLVLGAASDITTANAIVSTVGGIGHRITSSATTGATTNSPLSIVANSLTTGTGQYIASSSISSGNLLNIVTTGTAAAAGNVGVAINRSGANATNGITVTGQTISVTNTNATSGTNVGIDITASGATTANNAINISGGAIGLSGSAGTSGQVLTSAGASSVPTWTTISASSTWNGITNPTGDQALTFDAGESSTWTNSNTTEDLFTVNTSTLTTANQLSLISTSTALAAGNEMLNIGVSGANGTNGITATGARISVTNTNATSGTNVGLAVDASGATTANIAIAASSGSVGIGTATPTAATRMEVLGDATYPTMLKLSHAGTPTAFLELSSVYGTVMTFGSLFQGVEALITQSGGTFRIAQGANHLMSFTAADGAFAGKRFQEKQGTDVASAAGAITLGSDGNTFEITGTAAVTLISNVNWQNGSEVTLLFTSTASLTDGTANSGTDIGMELAGNVNFTGSAGASLTLTLSEISGTQRWREKCRSVN